MTLVSAAKWVAATAEGACSHDLLGELVEAEVCMSVVELVCSP